MVVVQTGCDGSSCRHVAIRIQAILGRNAEQQYPADGSDRGDAEAALFPLHACELHELCG